MHNDFTFDLLPELRNKPITAEYEAICSELRAIIESLRDKFIPAKMAVLSEENDKEIKRIAKLIEAAESQLKTKKGKKSEEATDQRRKAHG
ncbi:hypothetical protein L1D34_10340 [Vibrio mediterranei]|jgi:hypothetical protein|uniref:hypothetical protein n=1 Tax=Vibrio mediterranei TaxID=689 RepID=UPI001EFECCCD|nr:hypothetical protein [Vibrio mediterranei]MCG9625240.1 hypothetical protein [Vibrio mediterranei]MCY9855312.1 hypothetical protein [Vibrio mediterranei]